MRTYAFDFSIFQANDFDPFFGIGNGLGGVSEADFSTDRTHPRPYLMQVKNWSATQVDFAAGSSTLGAVTIEILDKRLDPDDQNSGIMTSIAGQIIGRRCLLRGRDSTDVMRTKFNGVVQTIALGSNAEGLVKWTLTVRDIRERERDQSLFKSNFVLFGDQGSEGPAIDYGSLGGGGYMLDQVYGYECHFRRMVTTGDIAIGFAPVDINVPTQSQIDSAMADVQWPTQTQDGKWLYKDYRIQWRPVGGLAPWITLENMPVSAYIPGLTPPNISLSIGDFDTEQLPPDPNFLVYFGSYYDGDLPEDGEDIEFRVIANDITETTPFWWDGGSAGDLLKEIYDGLHSDDAPRVPYSPTAMAEYAAATPAVRVFIKEPPTNMREWVEKNLFAPFLYAPALDEDKQVAPTSWTLPDNTRATPILNLTNLEPIGSWQHGVDNVLNTVEFSYIREHVEELTTQYKKKQKRFLGFLWKTGVDNVIVPGTEDTRAQWQRLVETKIEVDDIDVDSLTTFGAKKITFEPVTIRSIAGVDGKPASGDIQDEIGNQMAVRAGKFILARFANGAAQYSGEALVADAGVEDLREGDWVRARASWMPNYDTGLRGLREYMQIISINDEDPLRRQVTLISGGIPDETGDDDVSGTGAPLPDCLDASGGSVHPTSDGKTIRLFDVPGDYFLANSCEGDISVDALLVAGGGGGGSAQGGGGGGAGGNLGEPETPITFVLHPGEAIPFTVGAGAGAGVDGHDTILWINKLTGAIMDPLTGNPDDAYRAKGGGAGGGSGDGNGGGSGGGGGKNVPISGGGVSNGGPGESGQGYHGGHSENAGGTSTCESAAGGGGGGPGGIGQAGHASTAVSDPSSGGRGGLYRYYEEWGLMAGGGGGGGFYDVNSGLPVDQCAVGKGIGDHGGPGYGAGGNGGSGVAPNPGHPSSDGCAAFRYNGSVLKLDAPHISDATANIATGQTEVCVRGTSWPVGAVDGYKVRVEYAIAPTEPDAASGLWRFAGYLDAPGCLVVPPAPTGSKVWQRAFAEAPGYLPSAAGTSNSVDLPQTPGLLALKLTIDDQGIGTLSWTPNTWGLALKIRGVIQALGGATTRPLPLLASIPDSSVGSYTIPDSVPRGDWETVDVVAYSDNTYATEGRTYRVSVENPVHEIPSQSDNLDFFADVAYDRDPQDDDFLVREYDQWKPRQIHIDDARLQAARDVTRHNASTSAHGLLPKLNGDNDYVLTGSGLWRNKSEIAPTAEWTEIIAVADQDVVNNGTAQNDTELHFAVVAGLYRIQMYLIYGANDQTTDFLGKFTFPSSECISWGFGKNSGGGAGFQPSPSINGPTATDLGFDLQLGSRSSYDKSALEFNVWLAVNSSGTMQFQFCNLTPGGGRTSRRFAGSILRYRRLV